MTHAHENGASSPPSGPVAMLPAITRLTAHARLLDEYIVDRAPLAGEANARAAAYAVLGATIAAAQSWANAGTGRGEFEPYLDAALSPVCEAFSRILEP